jgi:hypothetical protein
MPLENSNFVGRVLKITMNHSVNTKDLCWKQKMLIDVKKKKKRESSASKALYVQSVVKGRGRR